MIKRYSLKDAEKFKKVYKEIKDKKGEKYGKELIVDYFKDTAKIALFGYLALPHYFNREFKEVHYDLLKHVEIGKRKKKNKASMMYRGGGKTSIEVVLQCIYEACYNIYQYIVINSYNSSMSMDKLRLLKDEFENNKFIHYYFGNPILEKEYWNKQDLTAWGHTRFKSMSTGENPRGLITRAARPQKIISDDILSDSDVRSEDLRNEAIKWYKGALAKSLSNDGVLEILNTPLHTDDIIMTIFKKKPPFHTNWDFIKIPAMKNGKSVDKDWRTTKKLLEDAKDEYTFQQEMMCNPLKINSGFIKHEDLRFWKSVPKIVGASIHADTTHTGKTTSDYFAVGLIGESEDHNYYLVDYIIEKCDVDRQAEYLINLYRLYCEKIPIYKVTYDEKANQGFGYWVKKLAIEKYGLSLPLEELKYPNDKISHFQSHIPHFKANRIYLPTEHRHNKLLLDQLLAFPQKGIHDDAVDMLSGCLDSFHNLIPSVY
jgi:predicted phage terminase large subunit-like protein